MSIIVNIGIFGLNILYFFMKCLPVQNKITYIFYIRNMNLISFSNVIILLNYKNITCIILIEETIL